MSDPNQGAFGNIEGPADYFSPKPLLPELNIEEYIKKDYKIDTDEEEDKFNEKYLKPLLNEEQWETWKVFTNIQRTTEITKEQETKIQNEANILFPTSENGVTSINNLNPDGLVTQEEIDQGAQKGNVMPAFGENTNVAPHIEDMFRYVKARADGKIRRGVRLPKLPKFKEE